MATATVTLNIHGNPPVTIDPDPIDIDTVGGIEVIHWKPAAGSTFTFVALIFKAKNPFQNVVVTDDEIIARDSTEVPDRHSYTILVKSNGTYYSSDSGGIGAGGPTIRNN